MNEEKLALQRMNAAEDFPRNTCPASRITAGLAEAMITGRPYPLLTEEREYCGAMLAATVAALWETRTELARLQDAVRDYRMAVDKSVDNRLDRWPGTGVGRLYLEVS